MQSAQEKIQADFQQCKTKLKNFFKNINNEQFKNVNYSIKINIILNCFDDIFIQKFKSIPDIFKKTQTDILMQDEVDLLNDFTKIVDKNTTNIQETINNNINNLIDKIYLPMIKELIATNKFLTTLCQISAENDINKITILDIYKCKQNFLSFIIQKFLPLIRQELNSNNDKSVVDKLQEQLNNKDLNKCIDLMQTPTNLRDYCIFLTTLSNITNSNTDISEALCEYFSKNNPLINFSGIQAYGIQNDTLFSLCDCGCLKNLFG